jgi:hypothetical protein
MGYSPQQINDMSLWQFMAVYDGYSQANMTEEQRRSQPMSDEEFEIASRMLDD